MLHLRNQTTLHWPKPPICVAIKKKTWLSHAPLRTDGGVVGVHRALLSGVGSNVPTPEGYSDPVDSGAGARTRPGEANVGVAVDREALVCRDLLQLLQPCGAHGTQTAATTGAETGAQHASRGPAGEEGGGKGVVVAAARSQISADIGLAGAHVQVHGQVRALLQDGAVKAPASTDTVSN